MNTMTALKKQAIEILQEVPESKMHYVITILNSLKGLFDNKTDSPLTTTTEPSSPPETLRAWKNLKKYKGIIPTAIDEKATLAKARDEKYAHFV